ncbi:hypothetical protein PTKIN_Ptkin19aG0014400 [Pterospermum kingtungense]
MMTKKVDIVLGESIGEVVEVETCGGKLAWGKILHVRVLFNVIQPLKQGKMVALEAKGKILVQFKYEQMLTCVIFAVF